MITEESMIERATCFYLGRYKVRSDFSDGPIYLELYPVRIEGKWTNKWIVRLDYNRGGDFDSSVFLNKNKEWLYKRLSYWNTWQEALAFFNICIKWDTGDTKDES